jgi:hypothetical protein
MCLYFRVEEHDLNDVTLWRRAKQQNLLLKGPGNYESEAQIDSI